MVGLLALEDAAIGHKHISMGVELDQANGLRQHTGIAQATQHH